MPNSLHKLSRLSFGELRSLAYAWTILAIISLALRCGLSVSRFTRWLDRVPASRRIQPRVEDLSRAVSVASRHHLLPARCLERSLALRYLLARAGVVSRLRIGARATENQLEAHAWIEIEGRPIGEADSVDRDFPPLERVAVRQAGS